MKIHSYITVIGGRGEPERSHQARPEAAYRKMRRARISRLDSGIARPDVIFGYDRWYSRGMIPILATLSYAHVVQGVIVGAVLAFVTAQLIMNVVMKAITTTVNGWSITMKAGQPGNGLMVRAACARTLPGVNVVHEAAYWTTTVDGRVLGTSARKPPFSGTVC